MTAQNREVKKDMSEGESSGHANQMVTEAASYQQPQKSLLQQWALVKQCCYQAYFFSGREGF